MAAAQEIAAVEFLQGRGRQTLFLQRDLLKPKIQIFSRTSQGRIHVPGVRNRRKISLQCCVPVPKVMVSADVGGSVDELTVLVQKPAQEVIHFFRVPLIQEDATTDLLKIVQTKVSNQIVALKTEQCFNIGLDSSLPNEKLGGLKWLLQET